MVPCMLVITEEECNPDAGYIGHVVQVTGQHSYNVTVIHDYNVVTVIFCHMHDMLLQLPIIMSKFIISTRP